jgi:hypothetical protein
MDLEADLRSEILRYLPVRDPADATLTAHMRTLPTDRLLVYFLNWRDRLIHAHPRIVLRSRELAANPIYQDRRADVSMICAKLATGQDVTPHLSRDIESGYEMPTKNRKPGRNLDLLLNEWGIHHLHLSSVVEECGFVARAGEVLFAIFCPGRAYLLDIMTHDDWENDHLVKVAILNWPREKLFLPLKMMPGDDLSPSERKQNRKAGLDSAVNVGGVTYVSGTFGLSTARTSSSASMQCHRLLSALGKYIRSADTLLSDFKAIPEFSGVKWSRSPRFRLVSTISDSGFSFCVQEKISGKMMRLE